MCEGLKQNCIKTGMIEITAWAQEHTRKTVHLAIYECTLNQIMQIRNQIEHDIKTLLPSLDQRSFKID